MQFFQASEIPKLANASQAVSFVRRRGRKRKKRWRRRLWSVRPITLAWLVCSASLNLASGESYNLVSQTECQNGTYDNASHEKLPYAFLCLSGWPMGVVAFSQCQLLLNCQIHRGLEIQHVDFNFILVPTAMPWHALFTEWAIFKNIILLVTASHIFF